MRLDNKTTELIAIGASIAAGCEPCLRYHVNKARENGAEDVEISEAVATGKLVRSGGASEMDEFAATLISIEKPAVSGCDCGGTCC